MDTPRPPTDVTPLLPPADTDDVPQPRPAGRPVGHTSAVSRAWRHGRVCRIFALTVLTVSVLLALGTWAIVWVDHQLRCSECVIEDPSGQTWIRTGHAPAHAFAFTDHCACRLDLPAGDANGCGVGEICVDYGDIDHTMGRCFRPYVSGQCPASPYWLPPSTKTSQRPGQTLDPRGTLYCPVCLAPVEPDLQTSLSF